MLPVSPISTAMAIWTHILGSYTAGVEEPGLGKGIIDFKDIIFEN